MSARRKGGRVIIVAGNMHVVEKLHYEKMKIYYVITGNFSIIDASALL
jgi:hypothetical protein